MKTSVIVASFRRPDLVPAVMDRLARQVVRADEIIYAEDDLSPAMAEAIRFSAERLRLPVRHVCQPNRGPRKPVAANRAARHASGDRLVFLDQDCLPGRWWIASHRLFGGPNRIVQGWRVHVRQPAVPGFLGATFPVARALVRGDLVARHRMIPSRSTPPAALERYEVLGCNLAVDRAAFTAVRGYDEYFCGWGYEDTDLVIRLRNHGLRFSVFGGPICVFHLDHPTQARAGIEARKDTCRDRRETGMVLAEKGLRSEPLAPATSGGSAFYTTFVYAD